MKCGMTRRLPDAQTVLREAPFHRAASFPATAGRSRAFLRGIRKMRRKRQIIQSGRDSECSNPHGGKSSPGKESTAGWTPGKPSSSSVSCAARVLRTRSTAGSCSRCCAGLPRGLCPRKRDAPVPRRLPGRIDEPRHVLWPGPDRSHAGRGGRVPGRPEGAPEGPPVPEAAAVCLSGAGFGEMPEGCSPGKSTAAVGKSCRPLSLPAFREDSAP